MRLTLLLLAAVVVVLIPTRRADACSPPLCTDPARPVPGSGQLLPANAPAVALVPFSGFGAFFEDAGVSLLDEGGNALPHRVEREGTAWIVHPTAPFDESAMYRLRFGSTCEPQYPPEDGGVGESYESMITVGPPAPLPTSVGALTLLETREEFTGGISSCGGPAGQNVIARLAITPSEELVPWLPVTRFVLRVDGAEWAGLSYGLVSPDGGVGFDSSQFLGHSITRVHAQCPNQDAGFSLMVASVDPGVRVGRHVARLEAFIAGSDASIEPATLDFALLCHGGFDPGEGPGPLQPIDDDGGEPPVGCGCGASGAGGIASIVLLGVLGLLRKKSWPARFIRP
ncbi:MAG: hypothetical protein WBV82_07590 [Myxococcaceae bacterium]